jgi:hypothetical protein
VITARTGRDKALEVAGRRRRISSALFIVTAAEYLAILAFAVWCVCIHLSGSSGDMPFELLFLAYGLALIVGGFTDACFIYVLCRRLSDDAVTARAWALTAALILPPIVAITEFATAMLDRTDQELWTYGICVLAVTPVLVLTLRKALQRRVRNSISGESS